MSFKNFIFWYFSFNLYSKWYLGFEKRLIWYIHLFFRPNFNGFPHQRQFTPLISRHANVTATYEKKLKRRRKEKKRKKKRTTPAFREDASHGSRRPLRWYSPVVTSWMTVGSRSTKTARGTSFPSTSFTEKGVECIVSSADHLVTRHLAKLKYEKHKTVSANEILHTA
jgi:hypothetical protein